MTLGGVYKAIICTMYLCQQPLSIFDAMLAIQFKGIRDKRMYVFTNPAVCLTIVQRGGGGLGSNPCLKNKDFVMAF